MGYSGDSVVDLIDHVADVNDRTGKRLASAFVDAGRENIRRNTPVETFHLRESYERTRIVYKQPHAGGMVSVRWSAFAWTGEVYTEVEYAPYVELGTGLWGPKRKKYKIAPKKPGGVLQFTPYTRGSEGAVILDVSGKPKQGGLITVRFVMHPGSPGHHMFRIGATLTEAEYNEWSLEPLRLWKAEVETRIRTTRHTRGQFA